MKARAIKQMLLTVYDDGTVSVRDVAERLRDEATGRFVKAVHEVVDNTPVFPEFKQYMKG